MKLKLSNLTEIYKKANSFLDEANEIHINLFQELIELKIAIYGGIGLESLLKKIHDCLVHQNTNIKSFNVLLLEPSETKNQMVFSLGGDQWAVFTFEGDLLCQDFQFIVLILDLIVENQAQQNKDVDQEINDLTESFQKFPIPVLLLSSSGEIILHNSEFGKLKILPNILSSKDDNEEIEIENITYKIFRRDWSKSDHSYSLFTLSSLNNYSDNTKLMKASTAELGIITSSLAHELNNPLGGMSAALSLILLEENFKKKFGTTVKEMKNSLKRCSELVNVFLGFSRAHPTNGLEKIITSSFRQSLDLLRFRMVESNICLNIEFQVTNSFQKSINPSILTMVFYLILNGVLTSYSKMKLLNQDWDNIITGVFEEDSNSIGLHFKIKDLFTSGFELEKSKLIKNLLQIENFDYEVLEESFMIVQQTSKKLENHSENILPFYDGQQELPFH